LIGAGELPAILPPSTYAAAAQELSSLGVRDAHADPPPLRIRAIRRRQIAGLRYERLQFEHDSRLPGVLTDQGFGGSAIAGAYLCRHDGGPRPWVVWVHGAGQGQPLDLLMSRAGRLHHTLGFNVALPIQPGHGFRRTAWPVYPDREPLANVAGMMRAVSEVRAIVRWIEPEASGIAVSGVSMGSPVAALVSQLETRVDAVAVYAPILGLNAMIAHHLARGGPSSERFRPLLQSADVSAITSVIDPVALEPLPPPQRRLVVGARNDQMALRAPALALHERWGGQLYWYDGSHVGHIFSRRIQAVTETFLADALTA
ncbi:MAG: alpha/beta hydrolase, partial [Mycobacteriaceae bacterium]|nr:alpha/beta hydrolase [Mycobacteriaceae bacterium]